MSCNRCVNESIEFYVTWCVHYKRIWTIYSILHIMYDYNPQMAHNWYMYTIFRCCYNSRRRWWWRWCVANCFSSFFSFSGVLDFSLKSILTPIFVIVFHKSFSPSHTNTLDVFFCQSQLSPLTFCFANVISLTLFSPIPYDIYTTIFTHTRTHTHYDSFSCCFAMNNKTVYSKCSCWYCYFYCCIFTTKFSYVYIDRNPFLHIYF